MIIYFLLNRIYSSAKCERETVGVIRMADLGNAYERSKSHVDLKILLLCCIFCDLSCSTFC